MRGVGSRQQRVRRNVLSSAREMYTKLKTGPGPEPPSAPRGIMTPRHRRGGTPMERPILLALSAAVLVVGGATSSSAQSSGDGYLFHRPDVTLSMRGGYSRADAKSDVFDEVTTNLTLDRGDFSGLTLGGDLAVPVGNRVDVVFSGGYSRSNHKSEFRDFVDNNDLPIEQTTTFERIPITANLRINLSQPGRTIGSLAW